MTDPLDRLWDEIPVGPAPVNRIIRAAKAAQPTPRARRVLRPVTTFGVLAGLVAAFAVGTLVGQPNAPGTGGGPEAGTPRGGAPIVAAAFHGDLQPAESCQQLLDHYVDEALDRVGPYGWETGYYRDVVLAPDVLVFGNARGAMDRGVELTKAPAPLSQRAENSTTGTNVQEAGVDEPDVVKTDGELLVRLRDAELTTYDVSGAEVDELGSVDLGDFQDGEILLAGDTVVAVGNDGTRNRPDPYYYEEPPSPMTRVVTIDVSDPGDPGVLDTVDYDTSLVTARQHGDDVRLVLAAGLPDLDFVRPMRRRGQESAREANERIVSETTLDDWLPHVTTGAGSADQLLECSDVAIPEADLALDTMAVVGFPAEDPGQLDAIGLAGDAPLAYESPDHLYLATQASADFCCFDARRGVDEAEGVTHVYDFAVAGTDATYLGSGEVEGSVVDRWAMDEYDGVLRLAVGPTSETGNFNSVVTLRAEGDELVEIGRVDRLGVNEQIEAVRWFDGLAIVVTFRQVDPLYAIDLTDASMPRLMGRLKIPGFSEYLHPLGQHRLVGVGQGPGERGRWGAQAGLFNVTDLARPRQLDVVTYAANTTAQAGDDPRQFTWLPGVRTVLTVIAKGFNGRTGWVSVLSLDEGEMSNRMVQVEYGTDIDEVRLVPLPEDRVVLVTGEDVEFFDVVS